MVYLLKRESLKSEPQIEEKKVLNEKKGEAFEFMKEEYKKSLHFKTKMENFKINKVMGRIKKVAKGPNPLSCKKKKKRVLPQKKQNNNDSENKQIADS